MQHRDGDSSDDELPPSEALYEQNKRDKSRGKVTARGKEAEREGRRQSEKMKREPPRVQHRDGDSEQLNCIVLCSRKSRYLFRRPRVVIFLLTI